ncbi:MAG: glycosyl transferase [Planctomycetota bacterium]
MSEITSNPHQVNVVCLKWGSRYSPDYVNRLRRGVTRHLKRPHRFVCFTDDSAGLDQDIEVTPLDQITVDETLRNDIFLKVAMIHSVSGLEGPTLFLDLDVVILGGLDEFFDFEPAKFCIIHNWLPKRKTLLRELPDVGNSSVFRFNPRECDHVLERFLADPNHARTAFPTEQAFLTHCMTGNRCYWPDTWTRSFKRHAMRPFPLNLVAKPKLDLNTKILVFHGRPDPDQAILGFQGSWRKRSRPLPELAPHWR